jgi:hypothetical protein
MLDKENFTYADTDSIKKTKTQLDVIKEYSVEEMRYLGGVLIMIKGIVFIIFSRICFIDYCLLRGGSK